MNSYVKKLLDEVDCEHVKQRHEIESTLRFWMETPFNDERKEGQAILNELLQCNSRVIRQLFNGHEFYAIFDRVDIYSWNFILNCLEEHFIEKFSRLTIVMEDGCNRLVMSLSENFADTDSIIKLIRDTRDEDERDNQEF